jgi:hypothetical protein
MKLTFLSKTARTLTSIGLMAILTTMASVSMRQTVQAQSQSPVQAYLDTPEQAEKEARYCAGDDSVIPEKYRVGDGTFFAYSLMGIEFSPEQQVAYTQFLAELVRKSDDLYTRLGTEDLGGISLTGDIDGLSDELTEQKDLAQRALEADPTLTTQQKVDILNEQFGQYDLRFELNPNLVFTPEQTIENQEIDRLFNDQVLSILEPGQQPVFLENLAMDRLLTSCEQQSTDS